MISFVTVDNVSAINDITDFELHEIAKKNPAKNGLSILSPLLIGVTGDAAQFSSLDGALI
jgi:hypothetical protein